MSYIFNGRLCGWLCDECQEPLSGIGVRLYRTSGDRDVVGRAVADPKDTVAILDDEATAARAELLLAETTADEQGNFRIELPAGYDGRAFDIDLYCGTVPGHRPPKKRKAVQVALTTLQPQWRTTENDQVAAWSYCLPARVWCGIRSRFGAWAICGRLVTCKGGAPVPGATVHAFDADWLQPDALGSATTGLDGRFRIDYSTEDFERTPFSPLFNVEFVPGPDLYFKAELAGATILDESQADGRQPGRQNVGHCACIELCTDDVEPGSVDLVPHWEQVRTGATIFNVHPPASDPGSGFDINGYAGGTSLFVLGETVFLGGNCPLRNLATGNPLQYRFVAGEYTQPGGADVPGVMPSVAPAEPLLPISLAGATVGYLYYHDAFGVQFPAPVVVSSPDLADGWIQVDGKAVTVDMHDGTTAVVNVTAGELLRTFDLAAMNTNALTSLHLPKFSGSLPPGEAGRSLAPAEQEPIRRYRMRFEVRDAGDHSLVFSDTLNAIIFNNSDPVLGINLEELFLSSCSPVSGPQVHLLYTVDHPHLSRFDVQISNNGGLVHTAPPLPHGEFAGSPFFRGGASGPHLAGFNGGVPVDVGADAPCAYRARLTWVTRRLVHGDAVGFWVEVLYCK
jgi:hypothetical protein